MVGQTFACARWSHLWRATSKGTLSCCLFLPSTERHKHDVITVCTFPCWAEIENDAMHKKEKKKKQISSRYGRSNKMLQVALSPTGCLKMGVPSATGHVVFCQFCGTPCSSAIFDQHPLANENEAPNVTNAVSRRIVSFWPKSTGRQHIDRSPPAVAKEGDSKRLRKVTTRE